MRRMIPVMVVFYLVSLSATSEASEINLRKTACRLFDSRDIGGAGQGSKISTATIETWGTPGAGQGGEAGCGVPAGSSGVVLNVTAYQPDNPGYARIWAYGEPAPLPAAISFASAQLDESTGLVLATGDSGKLSVQLPLGAAHLIVNLAGSLDGPGIAETHSGYTSTSPRFFRAIDITNAPHAADPGDRWVISDTGTVGVYVGHENEIATWDGSTWVFEKPQHGDLVFLSSTSDLWSFRALGIVAWRRISFE